jgi:hypothetical protein
MFGKFWGRAKVDLPVPVVNKVLVTAESLYDAAVDAPIRNSITIVNHFLTTFRYLPHELSREAMESYTVDFYMAQVLNGGHSQFAHNANGMPNTWKFARSGLVAMGANDHLATFDRFAAIIQRDDARARHVIEQAGFGEPDPEVEAIDKAFFATEAVTPLSDINGRWLRSLGNLYVLSASKLEAHINNYGDHPAVQARMAA